MKLDLHIHSAASPDGRMSWDEILRLAVEKGLDGLAVCDHDVQSFPPAAEGLLLIPGVEFSTECGHLLAYFCREPIAPGPAPELIAQIHAQGGLAVLAHPYEHADKFARCEPILPLLDGIEVFNARAARKYRDANTRAAALADRLDLPRFAGSDAHLPSELGHGWVEVDAAPTLEAVRAALLQKNNPTGGVDSRHFAAARSQFTKLKKTRASISKYLKWVAFAGKCLIEDIFR